MNSQSDNMSKDRPVDELAIKLTRLFYGDSTARTVKMGETYPVTVHQALALIQAECNRALAVQRQSLKDEAVA